MPRSSAASSERRHGLDRIVQEALTNVVKHANAEKVRLAMRECDGELLIEVQDDGDGFDATAVDQGFGLTGISERVSLTGARPGAEEHSLGRHRARARSALMTGDHLVEDQRTWVRCGPALRTASPSA